MQIRADIARLIHGGDILWFLSDTDFTLSLYCNLNYQRVSNY